MQSPLNDAIQYFMDENFLIYNVKNKTPSVGYGENGWSHISIENVKEYWDFNNPNWGMRTGLQPNGKYIIGLDFDMWYKNGSTYVESENTRKLINEFKTKTDKLDGFFDSSTINNVGIFVDISNCKDIINLLLKISKNIFSAPNYHLEIMNGHNFLIPPSTTKCKISNREDRCRKFMNDKYLYELTDKSPIYSLIYDYIKSCCSDKEKEKTFNKICRDVKLRNKLEVLNNEEETPKYLITEVSQYLNLLDKNRCINYNSWWQIGKAIQNDFGDDGKFTFKVWSKSCYDITDNELDIHWNSWKKYNYPHTIKFIIKLCKIDNLEKTIILHSSLKDKKEQEKFDKIYNDYKVEFEKSCCKICHPPQYVFKLNDVLYHYKSELIIESQKNHKDRPLKIKGKDFITAWMEDCNKLQYENIDFLPYGMDYDTTKTYNTFRGFIVEKFENVEYNESFVETILEHINLITGNESNYFIKWLANIVQEPANISRTCIIFKSEEGVGKSSFLEFFGDKILGYDYYTSTSDPNNQIFCRFNTLRANKLLINLDETNPKDTVQFYEIIKKAISDSKVIIEGKGAGMGQFKDYTRWIFTTNNDLPIKISNSDRRFCLFETKSNKPSKEYINKLIKVFNDKNASFSFYKYLLSIDISNVNWENDRPITEFYLRSKQQSRSEIYDFLGEKIDFEEKQFRNIDIENHTTNKFDKSIFKYKKQDFYGEYKKWTTYSSKNCLGEKPFQILMSQMDGVSLKRDSKRGECYNINIITLCEYLIKKGYIDIDMD